MLVIGFWLTLLHKLVIWEGPSLQFLFRVGGTWLANAQKQASYLSIDLKKNSSTTAIVQWNEFEKSSVCMRITQGLTFQNIFNWMKSILDLTELMYNFDDNYLKQ